MDDKTETAIPTYAPSALSRLESELYRQGRSAEVSALNEIRARDPNPFRAARERWPDLLKKIEDS